MKEDVLLFHGYMAHPGSHWLPWLENELVARGHRVWRPEFGDGEFPNLNDWLEKAKNAIDQTDQALILVGHSLGGNLILHLLENEADWQKRLSAAYLLGAPATVREHKSRFFERELNWPAICQHEQKLHAIWSSDDERVGPEHIDAIESNTKAHIHRLEGYGHFFFKEFPWLLELITAQ